MAYLNAPIHSYTALVSMSPCLVLQYKDEAICLFVDVPVTHTASASPIVDAIFRP